MQETLIVGVSYFAKFDAFSGFCFFIHNIDAFHLFEKKHSTFFMNTSCTGTEHDSPVEIIEGSVGVRSPFLDGFVRRRPPLSLEGAWEPRGHVNDVSRVHSAKARWAACGSAGARVVQSLFIENSKALPLASRRPQGQRRRQSSTTCYSPQLTTQLISGYRCLLGRHGRTRSRKPFHGPEVHQDEQNRRGYLCGRLLRYAPNTPQMVIKEKSTEDFHRPRDCHRTKGGYQED